jgi:ferredoxin, 2Fe-2S
MVEILIQNMHGLTVRTHTTRPLLFLLQENYIDWMHACGGKGRCVTCKAIFLNGQENCSALTLAEEKYKTDGLLKENERLACQVQINGNITIAVPQESKLPHIKYSDDL